MPIQNGAKNLKKNELKLWHMGINLRVLSESYPINTNMTRLKMVFKYLCALVLWTKVAVALEGFTLALRKDGPAHDINNSTLWR